VMRNDGSKDGSSVTILLGLRLGLDARNVRSRVDSLSVCALGRGSVFGGSNRLGDSLGFLNLDSLGNARRSALGWLGSVTVTKAESSLIDRLGEW